MCRLNHPVSGSRCRSAHREPLQLRGVLTVLQALLWLSGLLFAGTGCSMSHSAIQNLFVDPWHYCAPLENHWELAKDAQLAASAWSQVVAQHPGPLSHDYAAGFKEGYVDFLYSGGAGAP